MDEVAQGTATETAPETSTPQTETPADTTPQNEGAESTSETSDSGDDSTAEAKKPELTPEQKKIARQKAALRALNEEREKLQRELAEIRAKQGEGQPSNGEPRPEDFETDADYHKALGAWEVKQEFENQQKQALQAQSAKLEQERIKNLSDSFARSQENMRKQAPDYDAVAEDLGDFLSDPRIKKQSVAFRAFSDALLESDNPAALVYELGKNEDLREELLTLSPVQMVKRLARLEFEIESKAGNQTASTVEAKPKPITPLSGTGKATKDLSKMSPAELVKWVQR